MTSEEFEKFSYHFPLARNGFQYSIIPLPLSLLVLYPMGAPKTKPAQQFRKPGSASLARALAPSSASTTAGEPAALRGVVLSHPTVCLNDYRENEIIQILARHQAECSCWC